MSEIDTDLVAGCRVQVDLSGVGHCWRDVAADDLPFGVRMDIEEEIVGQGREEGEMVGQNGLTYRWF